MNEDINMYSTTDFYMTIFLNLKGFSYQIEKKSKICEFHFEFSKELEKEIENYSNNCNIPVLDFKNKIRDLKSRIISLTYIEHYDEGV